MRSGGSEVVLKKVRDRPEALTTVTYAERYVRGGIGGSCATRETIEYPNMRTVKEDMAEMTCYICRNS